MVDLFPSGSTGIGNTGTSRLVLLSYPGMYARSNITRSEDMIIPMLKPGHYSWARGLQTYACCGQHLQWAAGNSDYVPAILINKHCDIILFFVMR